MPTQDASKQPAPNTAPASETTPAINGQDPSTAKHAKRSAVFLLLAMVCFLLGALLRLNLFDPMLTNIFWTPLWPATAVLVLLGVAQGFKTLPPHAAEALHPAKQLAWRWLVLWLLSPVLVRMVYIALGLSLEALHKFGLMAHIERFDPDRTWMAWMPAIQSAAGFVAMVALVWFGIRIKQTMQKPRHKLPIWVWPVGLQALSLLWTTCLTAWDLCRPADLHPSPTSNGSNAIVVTTTININLLDWALPIWGLVLCIAWLRAQTNTQQETQASAASGAMDSNI